jgi:hypothetical protein
MDARFQFIASGSAAKGDSTSAAMCRSSQNGKGSLKMAVLLTKKKNVNWYYSFESSLIPVSE